MNPKPPLDDYILARMWHEDNVDLFNELCQHYPPLEQYFRVSESLAEPWKYTLNMNRFSNSMWNSIDSFSDVCRVVKIETENLEKIKIWKKISGFG